MNSRLILILTGVLLAGLRPAPGAPAPHPLQVSANQRFLVTADGRPFFWLGDTAWELFHRLDRGETLRYLDDRAAKGYTVIQAVALAELDGLNVPNRYGHRPLVDNDPLRPDVRDGPANDYWDHVDFVVEEANRRGLCIGFLPTWGDKWNRKSGAGPEIFTPQNAASYGEWLGRRYQNRSLVWMLGGDRPAETDLQREILRAMARGLSAGDQGSHLRTFHPPGGSSSAEFFHGESWLDFNMRQNGHVIDFKRYAATRIDYDRQPVKPVLDGEPLYEGHPIDFKAGDFGHSAAADVRRPLYWNLFSGACGHTYGHHSVWQMASDRSPPVNAPLKPWHEAIHDPGASQMQYGRWLMESRPWLDFIPDQEVIVPDKVPTSVPGAGRYYFAAARTTGGSCAMVYVPLGRAFKVNLARITGAGVKAWWFNPRDGSASAIGGFPNTGSREFIPPEPGESLDWILVLDDAAMGYAVPGSRPETKQ